MNPFPEPSATHPQLEALRARNHPRCIVCGPENPLGLGLNFTLGEGGTVEASFPGGRIFEGYQGQLHGGVIAALLDGAMTNCLFAHGHRAVTAELNIRYRHPVQALAAVTVRAWIESTYPPLYLLQAELHQSGGVRATATAKFMESAMPMTNSAQAVANQ